MVCNDILKSFSNFVANSFSFQPPNPATYSIKKINDNNSQLDIHLNNKSLNDILKFYPSISYNIYSVPKYLNKGLVKNRLILLELKNNVVTNFNNIKNVVVSHGNATDIGKFLPYLIDFCIMYMCNIYCYDYSGYGCSSGKATESEIYSDIEIIIHYIFKNLNIKYNVYL